MFSLELETHKGIRSTKWFCGPHNCCQAKGFTFWVRFLEWLMFHQRHRNCCLGLVISNRITLSKVGADYPTHHCSGKKKKCLAVGESFKIIGAGNYWEADCVLSNLQCLLISGEINGNKCKRQAQDKRSVLSSAESALLNSCPESHEINSLWNPVAFWRSNYPLPNPETWTSLISEHLVYSWCFYLFNNNNYVGGRNICPQIGCVVTLLSHYFAVRSWMSSCRSYLWSWDGETYYSNVRSNSTFMV